MEWPDTCTRGERPGLGELASSLLTGENPKHRQTNLARSDLDYQTKTLPIVKQKTWQIEGDPVSKITKNRGDQRRQRRDPPLRNEPNLWQNLKYPSPESPDNPLQHPMKLRRRGRRLEPVLEEPLHSCLNTGARSENLEEVDLGEKSLVRRGHVPDQKKEDCHCVSFQF